MFLEYINEEEVLDGIRGAIQIPSIAEKATGNKPFGEACANVLDYVLKLAENKGFRTVNLNNRVGYAEYGEGDEMVAVLGHLDVVPAGDNWICNPFDITIIDGKVYGRGIADDKGPIIGAMYALDAIRKSGKPLKRRVRIIFGCDEETNSTDMEHYKKTEELPVMAFTPDAEYPCIFAEKGIIHYTLKKKVSGLINAAAGDVINQVPDKAEMTFLIDGEQVTVKSNNGKTAHGSTPQLGINAIDDMMKSIIDLPLFFKMSKELKGFVEFYHKYFLGDFYGEKLGLVASDSEIGKNSSNVGILFGKDGELGIKVDFRFIPQYDGLKEGEALLRELAEKNDFQLEIIKERPALYIPKDGTLITTLQNVFKRHTGLDMAPVSMGGGTYAKSLPNTVAFGPLFPGEEDTIHQPNEYMKYESLIKNIEIMADAIFEMANCGIS